MKRGRESTGDSSRKSNKKARTQTLIGDLDDGCLLHVLKLLSPLPDLFSCSATCKRFQHLTTDSRLSVLVTQHKTQEQQRNIGRRVLPTLQKAVDASRAGDTIVLEAGQLHDARDVVIPWPLKLIGSGADAEDTVILCPKGPDAALEFRSTGKVANLTIKATLSNCILHRRGKVTVESCKLQCYAGGLEHLFTPLVTLATAGLRVQREHLTRPMLTGREAGMGVLSVIETKIRAAYAFTTILISKSRALTSHKLWSIWVSLSNAANTVTQRNAVAVRAHHMYGASSCVTSGSGALFMCCNSSKGGHGATAVKCGGTGALQKVRVIHLSRDTLFWFDVHASRPGVLCTSAAAEARVSQPLVPKRVAPQRDVVLNQGQGRAGMQAQAPQQMDGLSLAHEQDLLQRVKAWNTVHHPLALTDHSVH